jgi:hypothetical protein
MWWIAVAVLVAAWNGSGCTAVMPAARTPETRIIAAKENPIAAYRKSLSVAIKMGTAITQADAERLFWQGQLHNAVVLTGEVRAAGELSQVKITATLLPNKLVFGSFTEPDDFVALYNSTH